MATMKADAEVQCDTSKLVNPVTFLLWSDTVVMQGRDDVRVEINCCFFHGQLAAIATTLATAWNAQSTTLATFWRMRLFPEQLRFLRVVLPAERLGEIGGGEGLLGAVGEHGDEDDLVFDTGDVTVVVPQEKNTGPRLCQCSPVRHGNSLRGPRFDSTPNPTMRR